MTRRRFIPEYEIRTHKRRAGFVPYSEPEPDVEIWSVWCRSNSGEEKRATYQDLRRAGLKRAKK